MLLITALCSTVPLDAPIVESLLVEDQFPEEVHRVGPVDQLHNSEPGALGI